MTDAFRSIGIIVIGRNEGDRLVQCLASIGRTHPAVYVDSGSDDGSPDIARRAGVDVVTLDAAEPFTAARARNAGLAHLRQIAPDLAYIQMIDGDCEMQPDWLNVAMAAMGNDPRLGAIFGRLRERHADQSVYNWLCDVEWAVPLGPAQAFGGNVLLRRVAVQASGGYRTGMIAGEEPELAIRLRKAGWQIACIPAEMALHDAAQTRFGQWWRRAARSGHAFAELADLHRSAKDHDYRRSCRRIIFWGALLPMLGVIGLATGLAAHATAGFILFGIAWFLPLAQAVRITFRETTRRPLRQAMILALFLTLGKYAEMTGLIRYHYNCLTGRRSTIMEYKA